MREWCGVVKRLARVSVVGWMGCAIFVAHAQGATCAEPLHRLELRAGGGWSAPVGGTGGIMNQGWNVGGGIGFRFTHRLALLLNGQFQQEGIGSNVLSFQLYPTGNYKLWTATLDPVFAYWEHGKYSGYVTGGGGYSRILTTFSGPDYGPECYFSCSTTQSSGSSIYHYSSNQQMGDAGLGFTMRPWIRHRYRVYVEARYENMYVNSDMAPYKNVEIIPVTVGLEW